ncbi:uncharacterized protein [Elaeis guineensis]|uniref:uncharacterized protein n=1 Tax=Elaeis guineensis var. tenera TaxID=51953 RepID=UPI003C6CFAE3
MVDQLKQSVDHEARLEEEISRLTEEVSHLTDALAASGAELQSAREKAKRKSRTVRRLRHERDDYVGELKAEREQLQVSLGNLTKVKENLSSAQADGDIARVEAESAREAIGRAVEDFRGSDEYREELLESDFISYRVGYEDARKAVQSLYPELDLSSIVLSGSEGQAAGELADPSSRDHTAAEEAIPEQVTKGEAAPNLEATPARATALIALELLPVEDADSDE